MANEQQTGFGRAFLQENGASPANAYVYQGQGRLGGFTDPRGSVTAVKGPSASVYDTFDVVDSMKGEATLPTTSFVARLTPRSRMLFMKCPFDIQAHFGRCTTPSDYHSWNQVVAFEQATFTQLTGSELTALDDTERALVTITGEITGQRIWYLHAMGIAEVAGGEVTDEVIGVAMDQRVMCGECGIPSDGSQRMYAVVKRSAETSPGLAAELLVSEDGGANWDDFIIDTLAFDEDPSGFAVVGNFAVVVSNDSGSMHYASLDDPGTWTEIDTGFDPAGPPNAIFALNSTAVWIVGDAGYIYFTEDITQGVVVQNTGAAAGAENLYRVHAMSYDVVIACGAGSAVVFSVNGGVTWAAVGGIGLPIGATFWLGWARTELCWMVGGTGGTMFYTVNAGATWTNKGFPGSGTGTAYDVVFSLHANSPFGFLAHTPATGRGRILRTLDGGYSWHQLPEGATLMPDNTRIVCLAACGNPNILLAGGLGAAGDDGILVVGS